MNKETHSEQLREAEDIEATLQKRKKRYEGMSLAALLAEMEKKSSEIERYGESADAAYDSVEDKAADIEKESSDDASDWDDWEEWTDQKER